MSFTPPPSPVSIPTGASWLDGVTNAVIMKSRYAKGIGGFVFDYESESAATHQADITDHYLENNIAVEDHMAVKPVRLTLRGFVAELVLTVPGIIQAISSIQSRLALVPGYLGRYTPQQLQAVQKTLTTAQNAVTALNQKISQVQNVVGMFTGASPQITKQKRAYNQLVSLMNQRIPFTVDTPFNYYSNMVIESLSFVQPEETRYWSDITVTLKQLRFIGTKTISTPAAFKAARAALQGQGQVDQGKTKGKDVSVLKVLTNFARN